MKELNIKPLNIEQLNLESAPPPLNEETPQRHQDTKAHKDLLFSIIHLVKLRGFVPLWRKKTFRRGLTLEQLNFEP